MASAMMHLVDYSMERTMTIEQRMHLKYDESKTYSVIIYGGKTPEIINPETLCPRVVKMNKNKTEVRNRGGVLCTEYVQPHHLQIQSKDGYKYRMLNYVVTNWSTPITKLQCMKKADAEPLNALKRFVNSNIVALIFHNGMTDDACEINGLHLHLIVQSDGSHICKNDAWRKVRSCLLKTMFVKTAKIVMHKKFYAHMLSAPRVFIGTNNKEMLFKLQTCHMREDVSLYRHMIEDINMAAKTTLEKSETIEEDEPQCDEEVIAAGCFSELMNYKPQQTVHRKTPESSPSCCYGFYDPTDVPSEASPSHPNICTPTLRQIMKGELAPRPSKSSVNIDLAMELMRKYNELSPDLLFMAICKGQDEGDIYKIGQLRALPYGLKTFLTAAENINLIAKATTNNYVHLFLNMKIDNDVNQFLDYQMTVEALNRWFDDQKINKFLFAKQAYMVLSKQCAKKNTLYLQGESNAGKTWILRSFLPDMSVVGQTTESTEFKWQDFANKWIGLVSEMTITSIDVANKAKEIFGGETTQINIKNKPPVMLSRIPVLLSSNLFIWDHFATEAPALRNRMYMYCSLKELPWLIEYSKFPNPLYWQTVFRVISDFEKENQTNVEEVMSTDLEQLLDNALFEAFDVAAAISAENTNAYRLCRTNADVDRTLSVSSEDEDIQCSQLFPGQPDVSDGSVISINVNCLKRSSVGGQNLTAKRLKVMNSSSSESEVE